MPHNLNKMMKDAECSQSKIQEIFIIIIIII